MIRQLILEQIATRPGSPLHMHYRRGTSHRLVVALSGVGTNPHEPPPLEFVQTAITSANNHTLYVSDASRSWLNAPGMDREIIEAVNRITHKAGLSDVVLLGDSMGASMALFLAEHIPARSVIALTPQYSADPKVVPEEKRWMRFRKKIKHFSYREVKIQNRPDQFTLILHGGTEDELVHALRFPNVHGVRHFILPEEGHTLSKSLKRKGILQPVIQLAIEVRPFRLRKLLED